MSRVNFETKIGVIRVYAEGHSFENGDPYLVTMLAAPHYEDKHGVVLEGAIGGLSNEVNIEIGTALLNYGYKRLYFKVQEGSLATRYAAYVETVDGFDFYKVDLEQSARDLMNEPR